MSLWLLAILVAVEAALLAESAARLKLLPCPHGIMIYIIGAQLALFTVGQGIFDYPFLRIYSTGAYIYAGNRTGMLLFSVFALIYAATYGLKSARSFTQINVSVSPGATLALVAAIVISTLVHAFSVDWSIIFLNRQYLLMESLEALRDTNPVAVTLHQSRTLIGLVAVVTTAYCLLAESPRIRLASTLMVPVALWHLAFSLGGHSRSAAIYVAAFGLCVWALRPNLGPKVVIPTALIAAATLVSVLGGRASGLHGLATIPDFATNIANMRASEILGSVLNVFEGAFGSAEVFGRHFYHPTAYKVLSFSPLPSFLDGFDQIRRVAEVRLHAYVPLSSIAEVISFGPLYVIVMAVTQFFAVRVSVKSLIKNVSGLTYGANCLLFLALYLQFTYPVRNIYRTILIVVFALAASEIWKRVRPSIFPASVLQASANGR